MFPESQDLLTEFQCGFRKNHSTLDYLVRFETFIRDACVQKQHVLAFSLTWKRRTIRPGNTAFFQISGSLVSEGIFQIVLMNLYPTDFLKSELHEQEMGVTQGSILYPALFSIKINNIVKSALRGSDSSLFVDDCTLCIRGRLVQRVERAMQLCVNGVQNLLSENGFRISNCKTVCMHFCRHSVLFFPEPTIVLDKSPIEVVKEATFLGPIFDSKLTFTNHNLYQNTLYIKALDILRIVGHTDWGADRTVLLRL